MKKTKLTLICLSMTMASAFAQPAILIDNKDGWQKIGETTVDFKTEKDNIVVLGKDRFRALKFKVKEAAVDIQDLEVYYEKEPAKNDKDAKVDVDVKGRDKGVDINNNDKDAKVDVDMKGENKGVDVKSTDEKKASDPNREDIQVRTPIQAGQESKVIDLKGTSKELRKVVFTYRTLPNSKDEKATIELYGLR